jgi:hypothetical protein
MKNNYKTRCYVLFMSCGRLINYSTYCAAFIVCSRQYQSFVQVAGELLQSATTSRSVRLEIFPYETQYPVDRIVQAPSTSARKK